MERPKWSIILVVFALVVTGFIREFLFVNINLHLVHLWYGTEKSFMSAHLNFIRILDYWQLYYAKWVLTALFSLIYCFESALMLRVLSGKWHLRETTFVFGSLIGLSVIIYMAYLLMGRVEAGYTLTRFLMGMAQSPLPLMLLIPAIFLRKKGGKTE